MINIRTNNFSSLDFSDGEMILIDKPPDLTSFKVVHKVRKAIRVKKVGHAGTLDPMATGLLIIATGKKTKQLGKFQNLNKKYTGTILLGETSASMDTETELFHRQIPENVNEELIRSVRDEFIGETEQITPMYSAAKIGGRKLYDLARKGVKVEREPRKIFIEEFEITGIKIPEIEFEITCSKGTYIRVIANDFGEKLGTGAVLKSLRRTKIGEFSVEDAFQVDDFLEKVFSNETVSKIN
jgi:tRNA pseudouridine55 synthase